MTGPIVPTRMTAHFTTSINAATGLPYVSISFGAAEKGADGIYRGKGTVTLIIDPGATYQEVDPLTLAPNGNTITGAHAQAALLGLFKKAWDSH